MCLRIGVFLSGHTVYKNWIKSQMLCPQCVKSFWFYLLYRLIFLFHFLCWFFLNYWMHTKNLNMNYLSRNYDIFAVKSYKIWIIFRGITKILSSRINNSCKGYSFSHLSTSYIFVTEVLSSWDELFYILKIFCAEYMKLLISKTIPGKKYRENILKSILCFTAFLSHWPAMVFK